jgi:protein transport protein SEC24
MLPLYCLGLQKSAIYRSAGSAGEPRVSADERSALVYRMLTMPVAASRVFAYPSLYTLHDLGADQSPRPGFLPPTVPLSIEQLSVPGAALLLDDGVELVLWLSRTVSPELLAALLGVRSLDGVDPAALLPLRHQGNDYSARVLELVALLRASAPQQQRLRIVRQGSGDAGEARFHWHLIHERQSFPGGNVSYGEYLALVARESAGPPAPPPPAKQ